MARAVERLLLALAVATWCAAGARAQTSSDGHRLRFAAAPDEEAANEPRPSGRYGASIRRAPDDRRIGRSLTPLRDRGLDLSTDELTPLRGREPRSSASSLRRQVEQEPRLLPGPIDPFEPGFDAAAPYADEPLPFGSQEIDLSPPDHLDLQPGGDFYVNQPPEPLARQALKMFVRNTFRTTYIPAPSGYDRIEMLDVEGNMSVAMPWSKPENAVVLTPGFGVHLWQGPGAFPVPGTMYDNYVDVLWRLVLRDRWTIDAALTPGVFTDYDSSADAFRLMGRGSVSFQWTPQFQLTAGAAYLGVDAAKVLPIAGFVWEPRDDWRFEMLAPQPKIFYRVVQYGEQSGWVYASAEFSGGQWGITEPDGTHERLSYRDYRAVGGFEWRVTNRVRGYVESGWVFAREARLVNSNRELDVEDSFVVRAGTFF